MELEREGVRVPVEPQVMEVLSYLVANRERVVPKTELLDEIWGDRFVSESALSSRIKSARQAIGDNGRDQRLIRTVHGRGFRFVGEVHDAAPESGRSAAPPGTVDWSPMVRGPCRGRGGAVQVTGPQALRHEVIDELVDRAELEGVLTSRSSGGGELRAYGSVVDALDEAMTVVRTCSPTCPTWFASSWPRSGLGSRRALPSASSSRPGSCLPPPLGPEGCWSSSRTRTSRIGPPASCCATSPGAPGGWRCWS